MKRLVICTLFTLVIGMALFAQVAPPPSTIPAPPTPIVFDPTPVISELAFQTTWTQWGTAAIVTLGQNQAKDEATLAAQTSEAAAIAALQSRLTTDEATITAQQAAITALTARVAALEGKVTTAGTTLAKP